MANHSLPTLTSTYTNFMTELGARVDDAVKQNRSDTVTLTNPPVGTVRFNTTSAIWEQNTGTVGAPAWTALAATYGISITGDAGSVDGKSFGTFTAGGIAYASSGTAAQTTAAGTSGQPLLSGAAGAPTWGTLSAPFGGTGQTSYAVGDLLYASTTTALSKLADVATGSALLSGGVGVAPAWGKVGLTTHISGTLAVGNGGTGVATLSGVAYGNGTGAFTAASAAQIVAAIGATAVQNATSATSAGSATNATNATHITAGTAGDLLYQSGAGVTAKLADVATGNALISGGVGVAPSYGKIGLTTHISGTLALANGGTGGTTQATALQALGALGAQTVAKTAAYTVVAGDRGDVLLCTNTWTLTLTAAATLANGFSFGVVNAGTGTITIDPSGAELVDGLATKALTPGQSAILITDGTGWRTVGLSGGGAVGGGSDDIFYENGQTVNTNYTITSGKNAMSAGPITLGSGITVTIPSGSNWAIV